MGIQGSDDETERITREHEANTLAVMLVRALHRAAKVQRGLTIGGLEPTSLSVAVGLSPIVSIRFA